MGFNKNAVLVLCAFLIHLSACSNSFVSNYLSTTNNEVLSNLPLPSPSTTPSGGFSPSNLKLKAQPDVLVDTGTVLTLPLQTTTTAGEVTFQVQESSGFSAFTVKKTSLVTANLIINAPATDQIYDFSVTATDGTTTRETSFHVFIGNIYDVNPVTGIDATTNSGRANQPWKTIEYAVSKLTPLTKPSRIRLAAGTHLIQNPVILSNLISMVGHGMTDTILKGTGTNLTTKVPKNWSVSKYLLQLADEYNNSNETNGKSNKFHQSLSNFAINGDGKKLLGGIYIVGQENAYVNSVQISDTAESCIWAHWSHDGRIANSVFKNCTSDAQGQGFAMGEVILYDLDNYTVKNISVVSGTKSDGSRIISYGIKSVTVNEYYVQTFTNFSLLESYINVSNVGIQGWQPIAMELHDGSPRCAPCLISGNYFNANISLVVNSDAADLPTTEPSVYPVEFSYNHVDTSTQSYPFESSMAGLHIHHNILSGGAYGFANWITNGLVIGFWKVHNNLIVNNFDAGWDTGLFFRYNASAGVKTGFFNIQFYQNTLVFNGDHFHLFNAYSAATGGNATIKSENLFIANNILANTKAGATTQVIAPQMGSVAGLTIRNNFALNMALPTGRTGDIQGNDYGKDPGFAMTGSTPWSKYKLSQTSPLLGKAWYGGPMSLPHSNIGATGFAAFPRTPADPSTDWIQ